MARLLAADRSAFLGIFIWLDELFVDSSYGLSQVAVVFVIGGAKLFGNETPLPALCYDFIAAASALPPGTLTSTGRIQVFHQLLVTFQHQSRSRHHAGDGIAQAVRGSFTRHLVLPSRLLSD